MTFRLLIRILQFYRIIGEKSEKSECPKKGVENMTFPLLVRILTPYYKAKPRWDYREVNLCSSLSMFRFVKVVVASS